MRKVSIVIPAYNEEGRINETLEKYSEFFDGILKERKLDYELLIVINNTTDRTKEIVNMHKEKNKRIRYLNLEQGGKGYAVIEGFKDALSRGNDLIGFVDADMATLPGEYWRLINGIGNYDCAIASRYLRGSTIVPAFTFRRMIVGKTFNFIVRSFFMMHYTDTQCGAKLFKRKAIKHIVNSVKMTQWAFDIEVLHLLNKYNLRVREVPTLWRDIEGSKLKVSRASIQMLLAIIQLRIIKSPFRRILKPFKPIISSLWMLTK